MSAATAFSCIKISNSATCSSSSSSSTTIFRFSTTKPSIVTIRSSQAEGPLRRPVATPPAKPIPPSPPSTAPPKPVAVAAVEDSKKSVVTMEFQRQKAKELQEYFKQKGLEEANQGPLFGFIDKNEISNGRKIRRPRHARWEMKLSGREQKRHRSDAEGVPRAMRGQLCYNRRVACTRGREKKEGASRR